MLVRPAIARDAEEVATVLRRSIEELCILDHAGDAQALAQWLRNKTAETVRSWIEAGDRCLLVVEKNGRILGVGSASDSGEILLNYVAPDARFKGVSKAIVRELELYLRSLGHAQSRLTSTRTAHAFYLSMGYEDTGEPELWQMVPGQPMSKAL